MSDQRQPIFLLTWASGLFKAHWALFIPDPEDKTQKKGKYIHVTGSLATGFELQIVRGWDINLTRNRPRTPIELGLLCVDTANFSGSGTTLVKESTPRDEFENFVAAIPAPAKSLQSAASTSREQKTELSDCQWWITKCVDALVEQELLIPPAKGLNRNKAPRDILAEAPRH